MKKLFLALSIIGLMTLSSCGSQENCRDRGTAYKVEKQNVNQQDIATSDNTVEIR